MSKKSHHFLMLWPWPLTYDLEKLIRSGHYHYQCVYQIWEQSIPWFLSYRVNTIAGGGRLRHKTITSPDPSDTGDIIRMFWVLIRYDFFFLSCIENHIDEMNACKNWLNFINNCQIYEENKVTSNIYSSDINTEYIYIKLFFKKIFWKLLHWTT